MESQIWSKVEEKRAHILMLRGHEVYRLKVTGMSLTLKRKAQGVLGGLEPGKAPAEGGANWGERPDPRTVGKAGVSPGKASRPLPGEGGGATKRPSPAADSNADAI